MSEENTVVEGGEGKEKKSRKHYNVSDVKFCETWQGSNSAQEVADKLQMPKNIVLARSAVYRNKGVNLKTMPRVNPRKLDVSKLNERIEEVKAGQA